MTSRALTTEHKKLMAQGRRQTRIVERYLRHIESTEAQKRRPSPEDLTSELVEVEDSLVQASGISRLELLQKRENLQLLAIEADPQNDDELEKQFVAVAASYSERKGVSYSTWREFGVPKTVLEAAGIARTRRRSN